MWVRVLSAPPWLSQGPSSGWVYKIIEILKSTNLTDNRSHESGFRKTDRQKVCVWLNCYMFGNVTALSNFKLNFLLYVFKLYMETFRFAIQWVRTSLKLYCVNTAHRWGASVWPQLTGEKLHCVITAHRWEALLCDYKLTGAIVLRRWKKTHEDIFRPLWKKSKTALKFIDRTVTPFASMAKGTVSVAFYYK